MKTLIKKWNDISLILRIAVGLVISAILGIALPQLTVIAILGSMFVGALKAIAPVLVFVLVISSVAKAGIGIGKRFKTVITLYLVTTFLAAVVAVFAMGYIIQFWFNVFNFDVTKVENESVFETAKNIKKLLSKNV